MATIRKRGDKYQVQVRRAGFPTKTKSFHTIRDAKEWARHIETTIDRDELTPDKKLLRRISLSELVTRYMDEVVSNKKSAEVETYILKAFLRHPMCNKSLSEITVVDFAQYRDERLKEIRPVSLKRQLAPLHNMFETAIQEWDVPIGENPLAKLKLNAKQVGRNRRLRDGEQERLIAAAERRQNPYISKVILFALETAMRRSEILSLTWSQVNLKTLSVTPLESKNGHPRTIPLTKAACTLLTDLEHQDGRVFPITSNTIKMAWGRITKTADIQDLHFHDLRHEAVSRFFEMGLTVPEVASISGHRDLKILMRYAHASEAVVFKKLQCNDVC